MRFKIAIFFVMINFLVPALSSAMEKSFTQNKIKEIRTFHSWSIIKDGKYGVETDSFTGDMPEKLNLLVVLTSAKESKSAFIKVTLIPKVGPIMDPKGSFERSLRKALNSSSWGVPVLDIKEGVSLKGGEQKIKIENIPLQKIYDDNPSEGTWYWKMKFEVELFLDGKSVHKMSIIRDSHMLY